MLATYVYTVYFNESNSFSICQYKTLDTNERITCKGFNLPCVKGISYDLKVKEVNDPQYGKQYNIESYEEHIEETKEGIIAYLSCGIIKGIGLKTAESIYKMFGDASLTILDKEPEKFLQVKGISAKKLVKIKKSYVENRAARKIAEILIPNRFTMKMVNSIFNCYKGESLNIIRSNPYQLCEISGITFELVDVMARNNHFQTDHIERIKAASHQVIRNEMLKGNVCAELHMFARSLIQLLNTPLVNENNACGYIVQMIKNKEIRYRKYVNEQMEKEEYIYLPNAYETEKRISDTLVELLKAEKTSVKNLDALINKYSDGVEFDSEQKNAIRIALEQPVFIITGGPGTGKTTILKEVDAINAEIHKDEMLTFLSPTGRAARRITESTGKPAHTIHSYLSLGIAQDSLTEFDTKIELLDNELIIVDESSFIDIWTADKLIGSIGNSRLGFVGDIDQLPSVGPGAILRDLLESGRVPFVRLETIHRQEDDALNICSNAYNIKKGIAKLDSGSDFIKIKTRNLQEIEDQIIKIYRDEVMINGIDNVKCLCPVKKGPAGVFSLNQRLQNIMNPLNGRREFSGRREMNFRVKDPIMQLVNKEYVANGDTGTVTYISDEEIECSFMDGHKEVYDKDNIDEIMLAYATTVHKSQGSEYDVVITSMANEHKGMRKRNLLYTAVTRGIKRVYLLGTDESISYAIQNNSTDQRNTMLKQLIQSAIPEKCKQSQLTFS